MIFNLNIAKYRLKFFLYNIRYYARFGFHRAKKRNILYFVIVPSWKHPGLADRMKAIISLYNIAKANGFEFKIYFNNPFPLSRYLQSAKDWSCSLDDLEYSIWDTRIINETPWSHISRLRKGKQYHCYNYVGNSMPWRFEKTGYYWHELFQELFRPSNFLENALHNVNVPSTPYISVHLRFVNALEKFENTFFDNYVEGEETRQQLIEKCQKAIMDIVNNNRDNNVYVFSDSKIFLQSLKGLPVKTLDSSNIGHISYSRAESDDSYLKTFVDLFFMSKSKEIYRIRAKEIYNLSCFGLLAARIGNKFLYNKDI